MKDFLREGILLGLLAVAGLVAGERLIVYLNSDRGENAPLQFRAGTGSSTVDLVCSFATRLRAGEQTRLKCTARPAFSQIEHTLSTSVSVDGQDSQVTADYAVFRFESDQPQSGIFLVTPQYSGSTVLSIVTNVNGNQSKREWLLNVAPGRKEAALFTATIFTLLATLVFMVNKASRRRVQFEELAQKRISDAETKAEQAPDKAKFAWDLARVKLEAYFNRNLSQVNQVFWLAASVMVVGFVFVLSGIVVSFSQPKLTPPALIAGISGIITQFIGATFLVIYRSTMAQAGQFMAILERINTVGMAIQVLDSIPDGQPELKNSTRAEIVKLLLNANVDRSRSVASERKK